MLRANSRHKISTILKTQLPVKITHRLDKAYLGCIESASAFKSRLVKALSCHLTETGKESTCIINFQ